MKQKKEYDLSVLGRGMTSLSLRLVVAAYLVYLAWKILSGALNNGSPIPEWGAWLIFLLFVAAAVGFCIHALTQYIRLRKNAVISPSQTDGSDFGKTDGVGRDDSRDD